MINSADVAKADPLATVDIEALSASPVFDDLFDEIIGGDRSPSDDLADFDTAKSRNHRRHRTFAVLAVAAMVIAVTVGVLAVNSGPNVPPGQQTTPWEAARPLPSSGIPAKSGAPHGWELVGDILPTGWQLHTTGPRPGAVECPTTSTCYVLGNTATKASGPAQYGAFYVSNDFGASWSVLPVPGGLTAATAISCPTVLTCNFGALLKHRAVLLTTTDGGHQWTSTPVTDGGQFTALTCFSDGTCNGLMVAHATGPVYEHHIGTLVQPAIFVRTTDRGANWRRHRLQPLQVQANMTCSDSISCVVLGLPHSVTKPHHLLEKTDDGGRTWTRDSCLRDLVGPSLVPLPPTASWAVKPGSLAQLHASPISRET